MFGSIAAQFGATALHGGYGKRRNLCAEVAASHQEAVAGIENGLHIAHRESAFNFGE